MATSYKIRLRRFNGLDYDILNLSSDNIIMNDDNTLEEEVSNIKQNIENKAPTDHASNLTTYGKANDTNYGHTRLSDTANSSLSVGDGYAATPAAVANAVNNAPFVSYSNAQTLTDAQKKRARDNIFSAGELVLLWTNASPNSTFAAQNITLDLSDAQEVWIYFRARNDSSSYSWQRFDIEGGTGFIPIVPYSGEFAERMTFIYSNKVEFQNGRYFASYGGNRTNNDAYCIPIKIEKRT